MGLIYNTDISKEHLFEGLEFTFKLDGRLNKKWMDDLIYKIYSVYLYDNQLNHDYVFFYNRSKDYTGELSCNAPWEIRCALNDIYQINKSDFNLYHKSIEIMEKAAIEQIPLVKSSDFITLIPCGESKVSYSGALPGDKVEKDGKYKGLKKMVYTPYNIMWNETKSGINPHEYEVMGVWNPSKSNYSSYRIWEEKDNRESTIRDSKLKKLIG